MVCYIFWRYDTYLIPTILVCLIMQLFRDKKFSYGYLTIIGIRWGKGKRHDRKGFGHFAEIRINDIRKNEYFHRTWGVTIENCLGWQLVFKFWYYEITFGLG